MYQDFHATDRWTKKQIHCIYQALIVAIATRHADAVDIKFLVDGRTVWVALPHPAWVEYKKRTGKAITDPLAIEIAGHYLKTAFESGEGVGREMYSLTVAETLQHLDEVVERVQPCLLYTSRYHIFRDGREVRAASREENAEVFHQGGVDPIMGSR